MPNIPQYESPEASRGLQPSNLGVEAFEMEGRRVGQFYHQMGQDLGGAIKTLGDTYDQHVTQQYILQAGAHLAKLQANQTAQWDTFVKQADPNDHTAVDAFRQSLEEQYSDFGKDAPTGEAKLWVGERINALRQHMYEKTAADASTMAGMAAVQNIETMTNSYAATVHDDWTAVDTAVGSLKAVMGAAALNPNISPEGAARIGEETNRRVGEVVLGGIRGAIERNPTAGEGLIDSQQARQYLTEPQRAELQNYAKAVKNAAREDALHQQAATEKAQKDDFDDKVAKLDAASWVPDGHGGLMQVVPPNAATILRQLSDHPGAKFEPGRLESLAAAWHTATVDALNGDDARTDPPTYQHFASLLGDNTNGFSQAQVDQSYADHKLSKPDLQFLRTGARDSKTQDPKIGAANSYLNENIEKWKSAITKSDLYGNIDTEGDQKYAEFFRDVHVAFERSRQMQPNVDPQKLVDSLFARDNPNSVLSHLPYYQTTNKQGLAAVYQRTQPNAGPPPVPGIQHAVPPRNPGESVQDYIKRTGQ